MIVSSSKEVACGVLAEPLGTVAVVHTRDSLIIERPRQVTANAADPLGSGAPTLPWGRGGGAGDLQKRGVSPLAAEPAHFHSRFPKRLRTEASIEATTLALRARGRS